MENSIIADPEKHLGETGLKLLLFFKKIDSYFPSHTSTVADGIDDLSGCDAVSY